MKTSEILRAARGIIDDPKRWSQDDGWGIGGRHCAAGAIMFASGAAYDPCALCEAGQHAVLVLTRATGIDYPGMKAPSGTVASWNDAPERTHAEVLAAFDTAISYAEAVEQEFSPSACEPVEFDRWTPGLVAEALGESEPKQMDYDAWIQAWKDLGA